MIFLFFLGEKREGAKEIFIKLCSWPDKAEAPVHIDFIMIGPFWLSRALNDNYRKPQSCVEYLWSGDVNENALIRGLPLYSEMKYDAERPQCSGIIVFLPRPCLPHCTSSVILEVVIKKNAIQYLSGLWPWAVAASTVLNKCQILYEMILKHAHHCFGNMPTLRY